jgi:hypothetical protein
MKTFRTIGAILSLCALLSSARQAAGHEATLLPPNSHAFGHSMEDWLKLLHVGGYTIQGKVSTPWDLGTPTVTGSGTLADPLILAWSTEVTLKPGTAFLFSPISYAPAPPEVVQPDSYWGFGNYTTAEALLDGTMVMSEEDCLDYYLPPQEFNPPLDNSVYAVQGFMCASKPLSVGIHTLVTRGIVLLPPGNLVTGSSEFGLELRTTIKITVQP